MGRSKKRKSKKKTRSAATSGATAAPTSDSSAQDQLAGDESNVQSTAPTRAAASKGAAKGNDFVHELTHSVDPIAHALSAIDDSDIDYKLDGDCPFCLEPLPPHWEVEKRMIVFCCGAQYCRKCKRETEAYLHRSLERKGHFDKADRQLYDHCSLCRQELSVDDREVEARLLAHAAKGRAWAQYYLGIRHLSRSGVLRPNPRLGMELVTRSAKQGYPRSLFDIGIMYKFGNEEWGIEKSSTNAAFCLEEAAGRGHMEAHLEMARILILDGKEKESLDHLWVAGKAGHPKAIFSVGYLKYQFSNGDEGSLSSARSYLEEAADLGEQAAIDFLAKHFD